MLIGGCEIGSKLGHFPKIANLFNQYGLGQGVVKIRYKQIVLILVLILFDLVNISFPNFVIFIFCAKKTLILKALYLDEDKR